MKFRGTSSNSHNISPVLSILLKSTFIAQIHTVQLNLNLMLAITVAASKNAGFACAQPGTRAFC